MTLAAPAGPSAVSHATSAEPALRLHDLSKRFKVRRGLRETLRAIEASYEEHGGFRMRTLRADRKSVV